MSSESELYTELFSTYSNFSIPTNATPLIVTVYLHFLYILAVAETQETIKFLAFFNYYWTDSYLQWNSTRIQNIVVEANEIWRPDVVCTSCAEVTGVLGDKRIEIGSDGNIGYGFPEVMVSRCPLSIHNFPFDTQKCSVTLQVMSYQADQVLLKPGVAFLGDEIRGTTEWDLKNVTAVWMLNSNNKTGYLEIEIVIKRNSTCYVWVLMVPTFLACNLAVVGTFLPTINTGTRFSKVLLNVCVLLTMMVLLDIAAADIPKTSYLPQLAWFIFIEMLVCFLAGVISVLMLVTHHIVTICDATSPAWLTCLICESSKSNEERKEKNGETRHKSPKEFDFLMDQFEKIRSTIDEWRAYEARKLQWIHIFDRIDLLFLFVFLFVNTIIFARSVVN